MWQDFMVAIAPWADRASVQTSINANRDCSAVISTSIINANPVGVVRIKSFRDPVLEIRERCLETTRGRILQI